MPESLAERSKKGFLWDFLGTIIRQSMTLLVTIVLARLLEPSQFGIIGMAMVFISLSQVFIDAGFTDGIIQKKEIADIELSSIFYVNLVLGLIFSIVILLFSPLIGAFYDNDQVAMVLQLLCLVPIIGALGKVHAAKLNREMKFRELVIRDTVAVGLGGGAGVLAALLGKGVMALVWQQLVSVSVGALLLWVGSGWIPKRQFSYTRIKGILSFSSYVFFDRLMRQFFLKLDTLFIGKVFSASMLGYYSRAESLNAQIQSYTSTGLRKVIFPALSRIQDDDLRFKEVYLKVFDIVAFVGAFISGLLYFLSEEIIIGLLGNKWQPSVLLFQVLVFRLFFAPFGPLTGKSLLAKGYSKEKFRLSQVQRLILVLPLFIGYYHGIEAFTIALVIGVGVGFFISLVVIKKILGFSVLDQSIRFFKPLIPFLILFTFLLSSSYSIHVIAKVFIYLILTLVYCVLSKDKGAFFLYEELKRTFNNRIQTR